MFACFFITMLSSLCNWGKEKQYKKLHEEIRNEEAAVFRGQYGLSSTTKVTDLVVGDIIMIEAGMKIPADCILIEGQDVVCDESIYAEHGDHVVKARSQGTDQHRENPDPFLLTRSLVKSGSGRAVVCAVGNNTRWYFENPEEDLEDDNVETPLQIRLGDLAAYIGKWSYLAGALTFLFMMVFLTFKIIFSEDELLSNETL